jgi:hypothetical protein
MGLISFILSLNATQQDEPDIEPGEILMGDEEILWGDEEITFED